MTGYKATDMNGCCRGFKFEDKEEWLPLVQIRNIKTEDIKE